VLNTLRNALTVPDIRKRVLFVFFAFAVFVFMIHVQLPNVNQAAWNSLIQSGAFYQFLGFLSGGALQHLSIIAMGITPYINASIIMQLMTVVIPQLEEMAKKGGEEGRKTISRYTRYLTIVLGTIQATSMSIAMSRGGVFYDHSWQFIVYAVIAFVSGTMFLMWLGEQMTSRGVGNGISLIIFAGIVARLPVGVWTLLQEARVDSSQTMKIFAYFGMAIGVILFIVFMERAQRRLLIVYPKRQVGNRMMGGENSFLPLKINVSGVIPPIFASSLLLLPATAIGFLATAHLPTSLQWLPLAAGQLTHGKPAFIILYGVLIVFFCFFYTSVVFNPDDTAENLRKYGGNLPGIRPGKRTAEYIDYVLTRLTAIGALYIAAVCLLPEFLAGSSGTYMFGGTSILIVVSVTMDTVAQIQSHLLAHQYEGLIKKSKLRGGRR
jgi:preprotein translocase subunit SecY